MCKSGVALKSLHFFVFILILSFEEKNEEEYEEGAEAPELYPIKSIWHVVKEQ